MSRMNAVTPLKLPETLPAGLSYTIETSRKELLQAFSTFDSAMETHLFTASYAGTAGSDDFNTSLAAHLKDEESKFRTSLNSTSNKATLAAELFRVKQYWLRVEQELLTYAELVY